MKMKHKLMLLTTITAMTCTMTACMSQNYLMLEDDEWSEKEMDSERVLNNAEMEMDDWDR